MKKVLIIGAGRSASSLIAYMLKEHKTYNWEITIADNDISNAQERIQSIDDARVASVDILDENAREALVKMTDLVISMLPASLHIVLAQTCLEFKKNLLTASYISNEMQAMDREVANARILFLNECGLDPGLDHMTAVKAFDKIKSKGGRIISFKSYAGGLVAPECDNNPWHYKFTWNPRNVVLAGQGGAAKFIRNGQYKYIPYHRLFARHEPIEVSGYGSFEGYPNRDSLKYRAIYGLEDVSTMIRGTLRKPGFCDAWNVFVQLGMTNDDYVMEGSADMTYREFTNAFLKYSDKDYLEEKICQYLNIDPGSEIFAKLEWLGIFSETKVGLENASPAKILQKILEEKWTLSKEDTDMVVMQHLISYELEGKQRLLTASIVTKGDDAVNTAMAKTVGWPLGIAAKLILEGEIKDKGVLLPIKPSIYNPILKELEELGINFIEEDSALPN